MPLVDNAWYAQGSTGIDVVDLGTSNNSAGATLTLTNVTVPAGALIVVAVNEAVATANGSLSDGGSNTYSVAASQTLSNSAGQAQVFYIYNAVALTLATLTFTKAGSGHATSMSAFYATGIKTSSDPRDTAFQATASGNTAAPTVTSNAPTRSGQLVVGFLAYNNAAAKTFTQDSTHNFNAPVTATNTQATASIGGGHLNVNGSLAVTFAPTISGASDTASIILSFDVLAAGIGWWNVARWASGTAYSAGNIVRQNATPAIGNERCFICVAAGTSGGSEPAWTVTRGAKTTDSTVTWQEATGVAGINGNLGKTPTWTTIKNTAIVLGQVIQRNNGASYQICTTAGTAGNGSEPAFSDTAGTTTADNTVTWTSLGAVGNYTGWQAPHARLGNAAATNWGQAGNDYYVADNHAESQPIANSSLAFPASQTSGARIYCVDHTVAVPTTVTTGAKITTTGQAAQSDITLRGNGFGMVYFYGITFTAGRNMTVGSNVGDDIVLDNCALRELPATGQIGCGPNNFVVLNNTTMQWGGTGTSVSLQGTFIWRNTPGAIVGVNVPTTLFNPSALSTALIEGVDLSAAGSGKTLVGAGSTNTPNQIVFKDCALGTSVTVAATPSNRQSKVAVVRSAATGISYTEQLYALTGTQVDETTIVRTPGASDGVTPKSRKITTTANSQFLFPFESDPIVTWNSTVGAPVTVTLHATSALAAGAFPNNDDIWIDVEYLGSASTPMGSFATNTKANAFASGTAYTSDGASWAGSPSGGTFAMSVTVTPQMAGYIYIYPKVAKPSTTFYVDPLAVLS